MWSKRGGVASILVCGLFVGISGCATKPQPEAENTVSISSSSTSPQAEADESVNISSLGRSVAIEAPPEPAAREMIQRTVPAPEPGTTAPSAMPTSRPNARASSFAAAHSQIENYGFENTTALRQAQSSAHYRSTAGEKYEGKAENDFDSVSSEPLSTFSIDVDSASYSNARRYLLRQNIKPPVDSVRIEEMINYFDYAYGRDADGAGKDPFLANVSVAECPWAEGHRLVRVGIKGRDVTGNDRQPANLVFLIDTSGSMNEPDKLPLLKLGLGMLVNKLKKDDRVSIVTYASNSSVALEPTSGAEKQKILDTIENLVAEGSTHGSAGIQSAYEYARKGFLKRGTNRVILASDGDFNVGITSTEELHKLIAKEAEGKIYLSVLGFGSGNLNDAMMEQIADKGNGQYAYVDSLREARKALVEQLEGSLITIAKDVKIQVEFNPARVASYRLIGYENRALAAQDFNDDKKDAGEIGAGHSVTALYEIVPTGASQPGVDPLRYQKAPEPKREETPFADELMLLKLRYKQPDGQDSKLLQFPVVDGAVKFEEADEDFRFAASVAAFGMLLRGSEHKGTATYDGVLNWATGALGEDAHGYRAEFLDLVRAASQMK